MQEWKLVTKIEERVHHNNLIVTRSDKGHTLVILGEQEYDSKIMDFVSSS
jgi:hypothetical protein